MDFPETGFDLVLERSEMKSFDLDSMRKKLLGLAQSFAGAQERLMIKKISEAADSVGNTVDMKGRSMGAEDFLNMLRTIEIDFDPETGEPKMPSVIVHPSQADKLRESVKKWEQDPETQAEFERVMALKREEWDVRESRRKLVD